MTSKKSKRKLLIIVAMIALLIVGYFVGLVVVEKIIKNKAISSLEEQLGAEVSIADVQLSPFSQKIVMNNLEVTNPYKPLNNIIAFEQMSLELRLQDYWKMNTVHLSKGVMSGTSIDLPKPSKIAGWVDKTKYPKKEESLQGRLENIDLDKIKDDFKKNFLNDLKNTKFYKDYDQTYKSLKSKVEVEYKNDLKSFENDFKTLSKTKVTASNLASTLQKAQNLKERFNKVKSEVKELRKLEALYKNKSDLLNRAQAQVIKTFLDRQGFGDFNAAIQEQVQGLFSSSSSPSAQKEAGKITKVVPKSKRDDVLFFVESFIIKGKKQNINGEIKNLHNRLGEDFKKWIGAIKIDGDLESKGKLSMSALRDVQSKNGWEIKSQIKNFSLASYDFFSLGKILNGALNLNLDSLYGEQASLKALVDINIKKVMSSNSFLESLVNIPLKLLVQGGSQNAESSDMSFSTKLLTKLPSLARPLKSRLKSELGIIGNEQKAKILNKALKIPEVANYKSKIDTLIKDWKKKGLNKLFKSILKF